MQRHGLLLGYLSTCLDWEIEGATAETWRSVKTVVFSDISSSGSPR
jgi:hypothetical protein